MKKLAIFMLGVLGALFSLSANAIVPCSAASFVNMYVGQTAPQLTNAGGGAKTLVVDNAVFSFRVVSNGVDKVSVLLQGSVDGSDVPDYLVSDVPYTFDPALCQVSFQFQAPDIIDAIRNRNPNPGVVTVNYRGNLRQRNAQTGIALGASGRLNVPEWRSSYPLGLGRVSQAVVVN